MKRRTILILMAAVLVALAASVAGLLVARSMPDGTDISALETVDASAEVGAQLRHQTDRLSLAFYVLFAALLVALGITLHHISRHPQVARWRERLFALVPSAGKERIVLVMAASLVLVSSGLVILGALGSNSFPTGEETSWLEEAARAREKYGVAGFAAALYRGQWSEHDKNPLYIWALMPFASRSMDYFVRARLLSGVLSILSVSAVFFVSWRLFGAAAAVIVAFLFGLGDGFIALSTEIHCEGLLISLVVLSLYLTIRGFERQRLLIAAGALAGLAYMTQLCGLFLPAAFLIAASVIWGRKAFRHKCFYLYFVAFVVTASPLLAGNTARYRNPLSDYKFSLLWLDRRFQSDTAAFREGRMDARAYLDRHTPADIAFELMQGGELVTETASLAVSPMKAIYKTAFDRETAPVMRKWTGRIVLLVGLVFLIFDTDHHRRTFAAILALVVFVATAAYAKIAVGPQFVLPFTPIVLGYFARGLVGLVPKWQCRAVIAAAACLTAAWPAVGAVGTIRPLQVDAPNEGTVALADWLYENLRSDDIYMMGPDENLGFGWYHKTRGRARNVPETEDIDGLVARSVKVGAKYVVISKGLAKQRFGQFSGVILLDGYDLAASRPIPGWKLVFSDPVGPVSYLVFEVERQHEPGRE